MQKRERDGGVLLVRERRRPDDDVAHLIDRIRRLVAEERRLEGRPEREGREANRREIDRLHDRLAMVVRHDLGGIP